MAVSCNEVTTNYATGAFEDHVEFVSMEGRLKASKL